VSSEVISPDGNLGACLRSVCVMDLETGHEVPFAGDDRRPRGYTRFAAFSPDSRLIYRDFKDDGIGIGGTFAELADARSGRIVRYMPPGAELVVWTRANELHTVDDFAGAVSGGVTAAAGSPSRDEIAAGTHDGRVIVIQPRDASVVSAFDMGPALGVASVAYSVVQSRRESTCRLGRWTNGRARGGEPPGDMDRHPRRR
jgi:hypothetical protein